MSIDQVPENNQLWVIKLFINLNNWCYPCPIVAVYEQNWKVFVRWPSWKTDNISWSIDEVLNEYRWTSSAIEVSGERKIWNNEYAFAVSESQILVGSHINVVQELKKILVDNTLNNGEIENITTFIVS